MRILFYGAGDFATPTLHALAREHEVAAVVTQPDRPAGRKRRLTPTAVGEAADTLGLPVHKPEDVNDASFLETARALDAEAAVVIAFGQKLSPALIEASGAWAANLHGSLLPRHRGAAPINWTILSGDKEAGVTVIGLAERMDAGPIYAVRRLPVDPEETAGELHDRLAMLGPDAVRAVLSSHAAGPLEGSPQDPGSATRAPKLSRADGWVDFAADAATVRRRVHGLTPWPGVRVSWQRTGAEPSTLILRRVRPEASSEQAPPGTVLGEGRVATGEGAVRLLEVQPPGKRPLPFEDFARGRPLKPGDFLKGARPSSA